MPERAIVPRFSTRSSRLHADAVVADGQQALGLVGQDADLQLGIVAQQLGLAQRLVAELVARVGRVADQLAQEDLALLVERVDDQIEHTADIGLERLHGLGHGGGRSPISRGYAWLGRIWGSRGGRSTGPRSVLQFDTAKRSEEMGEPAPRAMTADEFLCLGRRHRHALRAGGWRDRRHGAADAMFTASSSAMPTPRFARRWRRRAPCRGVVEAGIRLDQAQPLQGRRGGKLRRACAGASMSRSRS